MAETKLHHHGMIIAFAAAVVAMGIHEINKRYGHNAGRPQDMKQVVAELHGDDTDFLRASISKDAVARASKTAEEHGVRDKKLITRLLNTIFPNKEIK